MLRHQIFWHMADDRCNIVIVAKLMWQHHRLFNSPLYKPSREHSRAVLSHGRADAQVWQMPTLRLNCHFGKWDSGQLNEIGKELIAKGCLSRTGKTVPTIESTYLRTKEQVTTSIGQRRGPHRNTQGNIMQNGNIVSTQPLRHRQIGSRIASFQTVSRKKPSVGHDENELEP
jgi:hypothetical protein